MYNTKFTLFDGTDIYPIYMNKEQRSKLRDKIGSQNEVMRCSCREDKKLWYRISEDLRFYPEHNGYEHDPTCIRYHSNSNRRKSAIIHSDQETATVYLQFKPHDFSIPAAQKHGEEEEFSDMEDPEVQENIFTNDSEDENEILHAKKTEVNSEEYKEPDFNLASFIRCINYDTFTERVINNKPILSRDYFINALFGRLKHIKINGMKKSIKGLTFEEDGFRFFYAPFVGCDINGTSNLPSYHVKVRGYDNNVYSLFIFGSIYEKALKKFHKQYGIEPDENTMVAGFQYYKKSKKGRYYKVIGRMHLFQVSKNGIYCNSLTEQKNYDFIVDYIRNHKNENLRFYIPAEDELINGILEIPGNSKKGLFVFPSTKKAKDVTIDREVYIPLVLEPKEELDENSFTMLLNNIKS